MDYRHSSKGKKHLRLSAKGKNLSAKIATLLQSRFHLRISTYKGSHFISEIAKIQVQGKDRNNQEVTLDLIGKFGKADKDVRTRLPIKEFFEHEIFVYEYILPHFEKLQVEKNVCNKFKSYAGFCAASQEDCKETIILENMIVKEFQVCKRDVALDYNHALLLIKEIGRLHALSFAIRDQYPQIFKKILSTLKEVEFNDQCCSHNRNLLHAVFPQCINSLHAIKDKIALQQYKKLEKVFFEKTQKSVDRKSSEPYAVVTHCDVWTSNLLYKYNELNLPSEVCLVDWQLVKISSPVSDISQIMFVCIDKETRDKHYQELINEYYTSFSSFLRELGSDPDIMFPMNVLQEHLQKFSVHGLYIAVRMISLTSISENDTPDFVEKDALKTITNAKKNVTVFNKRMRDILLDYVMYGYELFDKE
ncbi:hypothetical protein RN001_000497 [Aquatica leii]|uniref:CHK kinase-like domain-containing protein n=1 Tax=Aquatica leii TaxID=1421715 RepID=A0AAN7PMC4_9COLE|nr:hypothetical protein RN001_000497 [Aquatica leii]